MNERPPRREFPRPGSWIPEAVGASLAPVAAAWMGQGTFGRGFPLDDAWIHMVYGLSLATEGGLHYNEGVPSTGATSPLWASVCAVAHLVVGARGPSMHAAYAVKAFGVLCLLAASWTGGRLVRHASPTRLADVTAGIGAAGIATAPLLVLGALSGMEVSLTSALLSSSLLLAAGRRGLLAGAVAGLAVCARPEAVVALPIVVALAQRDARGPGAVSKWASSALAAAAAPTLWVAHNLVASGRPLPATVYAKAAAALATANGVSSTRIETLWSMATEMLPTFRPVGYTFAGALVVAGLGLRAALSPRTNHELEGGRHRDERLVAGAIATVAMLYALGLGMHTQLLFPESLYCQRYLLPVVPLFLLVTLRLAHEGARGLEGSRSTMALVAVGCVGLLWSLVDAPGQRRRLVAAVRDIDEVQVTVGRFVAGALPAGATLWSVDAGAVRYFGRRRVLDLLSLNTPDLLAGVNLPASWAADAVVLQIPYGYRAWVDRQPMPILLDAPLGGPSPVQVVARCAPEGGHLAVRHVDRVLARGVCRTAAAP